jgi:hypothetical protein
MINKIENRDNIKLIINGNRVSLKRPYFIQFQ